MMDIFLIILTGDCVIILVFMTRSTVLRLTDLNW